MRTILAIVVLTFPFLVYAEETLEPPPYKEGKDYRVIKQSSGASNKEKIEVLEVFLYSCLTCKTLDPLLNNWKTKNAEDIKFNKLHVIWPNENKIYPRIYYTARKLNIADEVSNQVFKKRFELNKRFTNNDDAYSVFKPSGITRKEFDQTYKSFSVNTSLQKAKKASLKLEIMRTPEMIIDGRYAVYFGDPDKFNENIAIVEYLIEKVRQKQNEK